MASGTKRCPMNSASTTDEGDKIIGVILNGPKLPPEMDIGCSIPRHPDPLPPKWGGEGDSRGGSRVPLLLSVASAQRGNDLLERRGGSPFHPTSIVIGTNHENGAGNEQRNTDMSGNHPGRSELRWNRGSVRQPEGKALHSFAGRR